LFAATAGPDTVFPAHSGNPNASVDLDHSTPRCSVGFWPANPWCGFWLSRSLALMHVSAHHGANEESIFSLAAVVDVASTQPIL